IFTYNKTLVKYINAIKSQISGGYQAESEEINPTKPIGLNVFVTSFHKWAFAFIRANGRDLYGKTLMGDSQKSFIEKSRLKFKTSGTNISQKSSDFFMEEISWMKGKAFQSKD